MIHPKGSVKRTKSHRRYSNAFPIKRSTRQVDLDRVGIKIKRRPNNRWRVSMKFVGMNRIRDEKDARVHARARARVRPSSSLFLPFFPPLSLSLSLFPFFWGEKPARLRDRVFHTRSSIDGRKCIHRANRVASRVQQYATGEEERSVHVQWQVKFPFRTRISTRDLCPIRFPKKLNRGNSLALRAFDPFRTSSTPPLCSKIFRISFGEGEFRPRFFHEFFLINHSRYLGRKTGLGRETKMAGDWEQRARENDAPARGGCWWCICRR